LPTGGFAGAGIGVALVVALGRTRGKRVAEGASRIAPDGEVGSWDGEGRFALFAVFPLLSLLSSQSLSSELSSLYSSSMLPAGGDVVGCVLVWGIWRLVVGGQRCTDGVAIRCLSDEEKRTKLNPFRPGFDPPQGLPVAKNWVKLTRC